MKKRMKSTALNGAATPHCDAVPKPLAEMARAINEPERRSFFNISLFLVEVDDCSLT